MADDTNFRSYRQGDPHGRPIAPAPSGREGGSDPLAELARLIGQTDPFADLGRTGPAGGAPRGSRVGAADAGPHADPGVAPYGQDPYGAPPAAPPQFDPPFDNQSQTEPRQDGFQPAYDPAIYGSAPRGGASHGGQTYYEGLAQAGQDDENYEDEFAEGRPRRGLKTVLVIVGLALLGTGAAFGYRAMFGGIGASTSPPVIKANTAPSKVAAPSSEASNKLIYDRVGDSAQGEKVVSREEQPVDVKDAARPAPRVVFPGLPATPERQDSAMASAPLGSMPLAPASSEPKKVRTVTIRPDQPLADAAAPRIATPAPRSAAPVNPSRPVAATPEVASPSAVASNAPLSLSPQQSVEAPARSAPAASVAPPLAPTRMASVSSGVEAGGYTVQISSQRTEAEAQASFRSLQAKYPDLLNNRQPIIRRADLGDKGIYFRAMVGPFVSQDQATGFCGSLKSAGGQCVVQRN